MTAAHNVIGSTVLVLCGRRVRAGMTRYLHTMYRITDPERSRAFYEALGLERGIDLERLQQGTVDLTRAASERCSSCGAELPPRPMRQRLRELLPQYADTPVDVCAACAASASSSRSHTIASNR